MQIAQFKFPTKRAIYAFKLGKWVMQRTKGIQIHNLPETVNDCNN